MRAWWGLVGDVRVLDCWSRALCSCIHVTAISYPALPYPSSRAHFTRIRPRPLLSQEHEKQDTRREVLQSMFIYRANGVVSRDKWSRLLDGPLEFERFQYPKLIYNIKTLE